MRIPFIIVGVIVEAIITVVYPFVAVCRGKVLGEVIKRSYLAFVCFMICLCLLIPGGVGLFDPQLSKEMFTNWVPDVRGLVGVVLLGWAPASVAGLTALLVRWLFRKRT